MHTLRTVARGAALASQMSGASFAAVPSAPMTWLIPKTAFDRHLRALIEAGLSKQLMYGSDQMEWPEAISVGIDRIQSAAYLTAEEKRDIFYNNAAQFLRLDGNGNSVR